MKKLVCFGLALIFSLVFVSMAGAGVVLPEEPVAIGHTPQFVFDNYIVDNHWALKHKQESMRRVFHQPVKYEMNTTIHTELAFSRDGIRFDRLPWRPVLIERGPEGAWDHGMVFGGFKWVEVGEEWWLYYAGWDGFHGSDERTAGIGLAKVRKEGFISMRGPKSGGVVVTRRIVWPGGPLLVNADAKEGKLTVRVSNAQRDVVEGFDYADCQPFAGDSTAHAITWKDRSLDELLGESIRLEILLEDAELYTFRAGEE